MQNDWFTYVAMAIPPAPLPAFCEYNLPQRFLQREKELFGLVSAVLRHGRAVCSFQTVEKPQRESKQTRSRICVLTEE